MSKPVVDWDQLDIIADGWGGEFLEIYREFLHDLTADIEALGKALENNDAEAAARLAHRIKGSASNFGFEAVRQIAYDVETAAKVPDLTIASERFSLASANFEMCRDEVASRIPEAA
ncbi:MAG: hypothetical protein Fur0032_11180 [Terrimicrobiaceae bacterium]